LAGLPQLCGNSAGAPAASETASAMASSQGRVLSIDGRSDAHVGVGILTLATRSSALRVILRNWTRPAIVVHCSRKLEVRCGARHVDLRRGPDARAIEGGDWNPPVLLGVQVWFMPDGATGGLASPTHGEGGIAFATVIGVCV